MAKQYGKKKSFRQSGGGFGKLFMAFVAFIVGYGSASIYDITRLSGWLSAQVQTPLTRPLAMKVAANSVALPKPKFEFYTLLANGQVAKAPTQTSPSMPAPVVAITHATPAGKTLSDASSSKAYVENASNELIHTEAPTNLVITQKLPLHAPLVATSAVAKTLSIDTAAKDAYLIQVGSFKNMREASRMKAALVMKGFDVNIATATKLRVNWYRVTIGPFTSRTEALRAQINFARSEHITGMIRKMNA